MLFRSEGKAAVDNINFSIEEGKLTGILGASGSGKTTLLNLMSGIQKPTSGSVKINGLDVFKDANTLEGVFGYVPQDDLLIEDLTVLENGGGLYKAKAFFDNKPFLLYNVDIISAFDLSSLYNLHLEKKGLATLAVRHRPGKRFLLVDNSEIGRAHV